MDGAFEAPLTKTVIRPCIKQRSECLLEWPSLCWLNEISVSLTQKPACQIIAGGVYYVDSVCDAARNRGHKC